MSLKSYDIHQIAGEIQISFRFDTLAFTNFSSAKPKILATARGVDYIM